MEKFFKVKEHGSTVKTEILAGLTTFMAMAYILMVNANMFSDLGVVSYNAIYIATALSAVVGTVLIALLANLPLAMASGMGLNAFFVYTVCFAFGFTYANALTLVLLDGVIFIILTVTGIRAKLFAAIPACVRIAIPAGIGLFIAFIGLQDAGIVIPNKDSCVSLFSFNILADATWPTIMPKVVTIIALIIIAVLAYRKIKGSVLWGILGGSVLYYVFGIFIPGFYDGFFENMSFNPFSAFGEWSDQAFFKVFTEGFDFSHFLENDHTIEELVVLIVTTALAFCLVDMFDTLGTLYGACARGKMLTKEGQVPNFEKAMLSDALGTVVGSVCGTSTVTTFVESSAGVAEGGRTGLSALTTGALFFVAMFLSPVARLIPGAATSAALIYVGVLMMSCVVDIDWHDPAISVPAFMTIAIMAFSYNISFGIAFGIITYIFIKLFTGKFREIKAFTWIVGVLFVVMFLFTH
jgi:AGZA family xanthine/uracil permease-like MFS transporter